MWLCSHCLLPFLRQSKYVHSIIHQLTQKKIRMPQDKRIFPDQPTSQDSFCLQSELYFGGATASKVILFSSLVCIPRARLHREEIYKFIGRLYPYLLLKRKIPICRRPDCIYRPAYSCCHNK